MLCRPVSSCHLEGRGYQGFAHLGWGHCQTHGVHGHGCVADGCDRGCDCDQRRGDVDSGGTARTSRH